MLYRQDAGIYPLRSQLHPEFYGTGRETYHQSEASHCASETREIKLPRTSYDRLNQDLPPELALADARRCRILKKEIEVACKRIDRNVLFAEQRIKRRGDLASGLARCEKAITEAYESLKRSAQELTDILKDRDEEVTISVIELVSDTQDCVDSVLITLYDILEPEADGSGDDNAHEPFSSKPRRERQSGTLEGPPPGLYDDRPSVPPSRREGPPRGLFDDRQSLPPSRPGRFETNDGDVPSSPDAGGDQTRSESTRSLDEDNQEFVEVDKGMIGDQEKSTELPSPQAYTDEERDETHQEDHAEKEPPVEVDVSKETEDDSNAVSADRAKLVSRLAERQCRQDVDLSERQYVRDVQQQECGKELDELTALRYQSRRHHRPARGRRRYLRDVHAHSETVRVCQAELSRHFATRTLSATRHGLVDVLDNGHFWTQIRK